MKRRLYPPTVLLIGLLSTQIIATIHVYLSNLNLLRTTETVMRGGYLAVPNALVVNRLGSLSTALAGGLFFTLSIGAGLSLVALIVAWLWDRAFRRRRREGLVVLLLWLAVIFLLNTNGLNIIASTYLIVVPLVTGTAAIRLLPARSALVSSTSVVWSASAAMILALLWGLTLDRHLFINIRDNLLLTNRIGRSISDAYYAYTLFAAEAFKSLSQKQIRTCILEESLDRTEWARLERTLRAHDYLPIPAGHRADLIVGQDGTNVRIALKDRRKIVLSVPADELIHHPQKILDDYADRLDRNRTFRSMTLVCLLIGFPLVLYSLLFSVLGVLPGLFLTVTQADIVTAVICVAAGVILLVPVYRGHTVEAESADVATALASPSPTIRIAALRQACERHLDVADEARRRGIERSDLIAERYWLSRGLACSTDPQAPSLLLALADDPVPIVACQAFWALGERKSRSVVPQIIDRINTDAHWYVQMYAYRALRTLGWVQPRSQLLSY